jgi:hypothetical protein
LGREGSRERGDSVGEAHGWPELSPHDHTPRTCKFRQRAQGVREHASCHMPHGSTERGTERIYTGPFFPQVGYYVPLFCLLQGNLSEALAGVLSMPRGIQMERRKALVVVLLMLLSSVCQPQSKRTTAASNEGLSIPQSWSSITLRLFKDSDRQIVLSLATSWIPGDNHQGLFRYKIKGFPVELTPEERASEMNIPEANEKFLRRAHACSMELDLYDSDEFILRKVPLPPFNYLLSSDGKIVGLDLNEAVQMDASEYRRLIGTPSQSGSWNLGWTLGISP